MLAEGLLALGGSALAEEGDRLITYIRPPADVAAFVRDAKARIAAIAPGLEGEVRFEWRENEDWAEEWKKGLRPRRVGRRIVVSPSWAEPELRADDVLLIIDPAMAFGTGEHATTRSALRLLESTLNTGDRVLDVGTGSGILAVAAAKLGAGEVTAVESDAEALEYAHENVERNGVSGVDIVHAFVDERYLRTRANAFDVVLANVLRSVIEPLLPSFHHALSPDGRAILGGILEEEAEGVLAAARAAGFALAAEDLEDEWWTGLFRRV